MRIGHLGLRSCWSVLLLLPLLAAPAVAAPPPPADQDGWGHFLGCFSILLDSAAHAQYCGPSNVVPDASSLVEGMGSTPPPPPPPTCFPCTGGATLGRPVFTPYQVATLAIDPLLVPDRPKEKAVLMACCPQGNS